MKSYDPDRPLISLHVPKCAGTSFLSVLQTWYGRRLYRHYPNEVKGTSPPRYRLRSRLRPSKWKRHVCVHGHFNKTRGMGVQDYYPEADQFITVFRDPFDLHLSAYFFRRRRGEKSFRDGAPFPAPPVDVYDIEVYLRESRSFMLAHVPFDITLDNYESVLDENYVYVGVSEDMQTTVDVLASRLGFKSVQVERKNASDWSESVPENAREEFIERHPLEFAIYNYALARYKG